MGTPLPTAPITRNPWWPPSRDSILFIAGLMGVIYETVISPSPDPTLLILFGGMLGMPAFLAKDGKK